MLKYGADPYLFCPDITKNISTLANQAVGESQYTEYVLKYLKAYRDFTECDVDNAHVNLQGLEMVMMPKYLLRYNYIKKINLKV